MHAPGTATVLPLSRITGSSKHCGQYHIPDPDQPASSHGRGSRGARDAFANLSGTLQCRSGVGDEVRSELEYYFVEPSSCRGIAAYPIDYLKEARPWV